MRNKLRQYWKFSTYCIDGNYRKIYLISMSSFFLSHLRCAHNYLCRSSSKNKIANLPIIYAVFKRLGKIKYGFIIIISLLCNNLLGYVPSDLFCIFILFYLYFFFLYRTMFFLCSSSSFI